MPADKFQTTLYAGDTENLQWDVTHGQCGTDVLLSEVSSIALTLKDEVSAGIVNSRNAQSVLNLANGTYVDGSFTWAVQPGDTALVDSTAAQENHVAQIVFVLTNGEVRTVEIDLTCLRRPNA